MRGTWNPALARIADLLTIPIPTAGIADVRDVVLLVCVGAMLIAAGLTRSDSEKWTPVMRWISSLASAVIGLGLISAWMWRSLDLSWGWIVRFAAGAAITLVIARRFTPAMVRQTIAGLLAVGVASLLLSIWHRADRGYANFTWPIGPITIVGGLAAVWAALAGVWGVGIVMDRGKRIGAAAALGACALCVYALQQTERRSPALGLVAGVVVVAAIAAWRLYTKRQLRIAVVGCVAAAIVGATAYVVWQARSADRERSGPIAVRKAYWEESAKFVGRHPLLGIGPDRFVIEMTMALAPLRAEMPHVYHGNLDTAAHNEWLQAAVELGWPAGLAYVALPMGVLFLAIRSPSKGRRLQSAGFEPIPAEDSHRLLAGATKSLATALAAAIVALFVSEAASINLRGPILPIWYWTLLGLLAATAKPMLSTATIAEKLSSSRLPPILMVAGGLVCLALSFSESLGSVEEAQGALPTALPASRLFAEKTLASYYSNALRATNIAIASPTPQLRSCPCDYWKHLFELLSAYRETTAQYAENLIRNGKADEAKMVLKSAITSGMSLYDASVNMLYASLLEGDKEGQFRCVQRSLRGGAMPYGDIMKNASGFWGSDKIQRDERPIARRAANTLEPSLLRDATVELLRIDAFLIYAMQNYDGAIPSQRSVAECYQRLERENSPIVDVRSGNRRWFQLLSCSSIETLRGIRSIVEAERYAVIGIQHEKVRASRRSRALSAVEVPTGIQYDPYGDCRRYCVWPRAIGKISICAFLRHFPQSNGRRRA
jgi:hypothetical protein